MSKESLHQRERRIPSDRKGVGKRRIPPLIYKLGGFEEVDWMGVLLPELLRLAKLNHRQGLRRGAEVLFLRDFVRSSGAFPQDYGIFVWREWVAYRIVTTGASRKSFQSPE